MLNRITDPALIDRARAMRDTIFLDSMHLNPAWVSQEDATVIAQENAYSLHPAYYPSIIRACNTISPAAAWWAITEDRCISDPREDMRSMCWKILPTEEALSEIERAVTPFDCMLFSGELNAAFSFVHHQEFTLVAGPRRFIDAYAGSYEAAVKEFSEFVEDCIQQEQQLGFPRVAEALRANFAIPMSQMRLGNT
ncbi:hypothetical protein [Buchananella felis]|uniref:hypothetical protein n=1 Tax=Buchananella felis TaxID=3231492 RepID=UPI003529B193